MLEVSIKKRLDGFQLDAQFTAGRETLALLGASGCGKSLTLRCIAGIEKPDEGRIVLDGRVLFDSEKKINVPPRLRRVGYLFQQYALFPNMTVAQNIASGVKSKGRAQRDAIVREKVAAFHLGGLENKKPRFLSGGEQQRTALARIFANGPELLLLDEPFSALDDYLRWQLELELSDTLSSFGRTTVFVSHNRSEVYRLCDSVCVLTGGRSEPRRAVSELFDTPETMSACLITGCKNFSRVEIVGETRVRALDWDAELCMARKIPAGTKYIGVRAHYVKPSEAAAENTVCCEVLRVVDDVFSTIVMLKTPGGEKGFAQLRMELGKAEWFALNDHGSLYVHISPEDIMPLSE